MDFFKNLNNIKYENYKYLCENFDDINLLLDNNIILRYDPEFPIVFFVRAYIKKLLKINKFKLKTREISFGKNNSGNIFYSDFHVECFPGDYGIYDKSLLTEFLKEYLSSKNIRSTTEKKIMIIHEINTLSKSSLSYLCDLVKVSDNVLFILTSKNEIWYPEALTNLFIDINIKSKLDIIFFKEILTDYLFSIFNNQIDFFNNYINYIKLNFRYYNFYDIMAYFENVYKLNMDKNNLEEILPKRYIYLLNMKKIILQKNVNITIKEFMQIRDIFYTLYTNHLDICDLIFFIVDIFIYLKPENRKEILDYGSECFINSKKGNKPIIHIENLFINLLNT